MKNEGLYEEMDWQAIELAQNPCPSDYLLQRAAAQVVATIKVKNFTPLLVVYTKFGGFP